MDSSVNAINKSANAIAKTIDTSTQAREFETRRYKVFHVHTPLFSPGHFRRQIYVEMNPRQPGLFPGHKFEVMVGGTNHLGQTEWVLRPRACSHPFFSARGSKMRHIGWVLRDHFDRINETCQTIPLPGPNGPYQCCHQWTDAAITKTT